MTKEIKHTKIDNLSTKLNSYSIGLFNLYHIVADHNPDEDRELLKATVQNASMEYLDSVHKVIDAIQSQILN